MNTNLPTAVKVIRTAIASGGADPAATVAHALEASRLLVDPERSYGVILRRTADGGWSREPQVTELERQARAWDETCARARQVAAAIEEHVGKHPEFQSVHTDGDRVLVALHITDQAQWAQWRQYFGITHDGERPLPYAVCGEGRRDGVRVSVVAYDVPQVRARAGEVAARPFRLGGIVYDLALPQRDARGGVWFFQGQRAEDGMPLLSLDGRPERCSLANVVAHIGPLTPVRTKATPVTGEGGEAA
ncbi:BN159_2729 family protein [Streptomyces sp. CC224B]|uniref:BN159_2729 family protein n=1 Tax=Streptomyces sp. CC224B TaxID=3044571 RepID=UPI0024A973B3|nr:BN159_2729 family protein [Streptomyces sp. CC224B]